MRLFHVTGNKNAEAILKEGFKEGFRGIRPGVGDGTETYLTDREWSGVWISDKPFDDAHRSVGITLFAIEIPEEDISDLEWVEEGKPYREWLVPAALLNSYGPPVVTDDYKDDEIIPNPNPGAFMGDLDMGEFLWMDKPNDWMDK